MQEDGEPSSHLLHSLKCEDEEKLGQSIATMKPDTHLPAIFQLHHSIFLQNLQVAGRSHHLNLAYAFLSISVSFAATYLHYL